MLLNEPVNFYPVFFLDYVFNVLDYTLMLKKKEDEKNLWNMRHIYTCV